VQKNPKIAWQVIHSLQGSLSDSKHGLANVPGLIIRTVNEELWREFDCAPIHQMVTFDSFERYVCDPLPSGLGTDIRTLKNICRDNPEALDAIDRACTGHQGSRNDILYNIQEVAPTGTSRDAALRRLRKDRPDLHQQVIASQLSAHAAMVNAGFRKKPSAAEQCVKAFRKSDNRLIVLKAILDTLEIHEIAAMRELIEERMN